jgi:hypothetical protein
LLFRRMRTATFPRVEPISPRRLPNARNFQKCNINFRICTSDAASSPKEKKQGIKHYEPREHRACSPYDAKISAQQRRTDEDCTQRDNCYRQPPPPEPAGPTRGRRRRKVTTLQHNGTLGGDDILHHAHRLGQGGAGQPGSSNLAERASLFLRRARHTLKPIRDSLPEIRNSLNTADRGATRDRIRPRATARVTLDAHIHVSADSSSSHQQAVRCMLIEPSPKHSDC